MSGLHLLAIDLGASSGRGMLASLRDGRVSLREVHRFANAPITLPTGLHWNVGALHGHVLSALGAAAAEHALASVALDTWGVDYALVSEAGEMMGLPHHYRDPRTDGLAARVAAKVSPERVYARTGIQDMAINTLYQLCADAASDPARLSAAHGLAFMPDLLTYFLTGRRTCERTIASTSQLLDGTAPAGSTAWAFDVVKALGLPTRIFGDVVGPGTRLGPLAERVRGAAHGRAVEVIAVGSHDTASAVAGVPARRGTNWAYISSGTWSLVGVELDAPVRTEAARRANFTNEAGVCSTVRFHKNVAGLFILQECVRVWERAGFVRAGAEGLKELLASAESARCESVFDTSRGEFTRFGDMAGAVREACRVAGQAVPETPPEMTRTILRSLARSYRDVLDQARTVTGRRIDVVHIVGGGAQNRLLCQMTAEETGLEVLAGPVEATALGSALTQAMALGEIGSLEEVRDVVRESVELARYVPGGGGGRGAA